MDINEIYRLIEFSIEKIEYATKTYSQFSKTIEWISIRKLLNTMINLLKENKKTLLNLLQTGNINSIFNPEQNITFPKDELFKNVKYEKKMKNIDFLSMVVLQQDEFIKLYSFLHSQAGHKDVKYILSTLAQDARKQKLWSLDRYELEILTLL